MVSNDLMLLQLLEVILSYYAVLSCAVVVYFFRDQQPFQLVDAEKASKMLVLVMHLVEKFLASQDSDRIPVEKMALDHETLKMDLAVWSLLTVVVVVAAAVNDAVVHKLPDHKNVYVSTVMSRYQNSDHTYYTLFAYDNRHAFACVGTSSKIACMP